MVTSKSRIDATTDIVEITFTDTSTWEDTQNSYYLVERENEVRFIQLNDLVSGEIIILIDTTDDTKVNVVAKTVQSTKVIKKEFSGWVITVERRHIFLTVTNSSESNLSFAAIEHNNTFAGDPCANKTTCGQYQNECGQSSGVFYCNGSTCQYCESLGP
jgi:hypothetical protein